MKNRIPPLEKMAVEFLEGKNNNGKNDNTRPQRQIKRS